MNPSGNCENSLDAEWIDSNRKLWQFDVKSKDVDWKHHVVPLNHRIEPVYIDAHFSYMSHHRETFPPDQRRQVLVCHDMMGNYREDKYFHSSKKFDDYRFFHWSGIDYFCYFSHKYVTIPPCVWINAAHKHGVRVLGTFITEGQQGSKLLEEVLFSRQSVKDTVNALVNLCNHFGFEGWLVNIECKVSHQFMDNLLYFLRHLRLQTEERVSNSVVFWYDSVIDNGELMWQNEINSHNVRFFRDSDAMLINYTWDERSLDKTSESLVALGEKFTKSFFGIDVFGRGQVAKFQSKQTLGRIAKRGFSVGIFAPAWTYETLQQYNYDIHSPNGNDDANVAFLERNDKFWWSLWEHLPTHPYVQLPFYTDFCLGSGKNTFTLGQSDGEGRFFNLSKQSLQPSVPLYRVAERYYDDTFNGGSCLKINYSENSFRLFVTDFAIRNGGIIFAYAFKLDPTVGEVDCILRFSLEDNSKDCYLFLGDYFDTYNFEKGRCYVSPIKEEYTATLQNFTSGTEKIPIELNGSTFNGWKVRYYALRFDSSETVHIRDVGTLFRKVKSAPSEACVYLGAIYLNAINAVDFDMPSMSNFAVIPLETKELLN